jgi:putative transposase
VYQKKAFIPIIRNLQQQERLSLSHCCRLFGISRQAIYQSEHRYYCRSKELELVKKKVQKVRMSMPRIGTRKLHYLLEAELKELGVKIGRDGMFQFLREEHMLIKRRKNYTKTTNSKHWLRKHPNLLPSQKLDKPEQVFVSDITYIKSKERTHYLSLVTDAYSRKIMGYHLSDDMYSENVVKALKMANNLSINTKGTIHHSDRGIQYCSTTYQNELIKNDMICSMTDGYDCYQNALAERINGILKEEFLFHKCKSGKQLNNLIKESIHIYNTKRPHLSLNMKTPEYIHEKAREVNSSGS